MCGRTSLFVDPADLEDRFDAALAAPSSYRPRYNIAPGDPLAVITNEDTDVIDQYQWGLMPPWADETDEGFMNARAETAHEKRSFSSSWAQRPCLVLSSGFYEWQDTGGPKQPYRIYRADDVAFALAGLWRTWEGKNGTRQTVTILTTEANDLVEPIHDRMPVILPREAERRWLEGTPEERAALCGPYPVGDLSAYPISTAVNDPTNDDESLIDPLDTEQSGLGSFG